MYKDTLNFEMFETVYYYHNRIDNIDLYTIGCELSEWDGEKIVENIKASLHPSDDIIILNTCAVKHYTHVGSLRLAEVLKGLYPGKQLYITGCGVDFSEAEYAKFGICLKNAVKFDCSSYNREDNGPDLIFKRNISTDSHGYVKIQDGCRNNCAYCIINKLRAVPFSFPYEDICKQTEVLLQQGKVNIELLGTELCFYSHDGLKVSDICSKLLKDFPKIESLTLGALDPASKQVEKIMDIIRNEPRMANNVVLSTQSLSNTILKKMKRRHTVERIFELVEYANNEIDFVFHILPGFPGETDELFNETVMNIRKIRPLYLHIMGFSKREGTLAAEMVQNNSEETILYRENVLMQLAEENKQYNNYATKGVKWEESPLVVFRERIEYYPQVIHTIPTYKTIEELDNNSELQIISSDLRSLDIFRKLVHKLDGMVDTSNVILYIPSDRELDYEMFEVYNKILTIDYNIRIILGVQITTDYMLNIVNSPFTLFEDFVFYKNAFVRLLPSADMDNVVFLKFIKKLHIEELYDITRLYLDFQDCPEYCDLIYEYLENV